MYNEILVYDMKFVEKRILMKYCIQPNPEREFPSLLLSSSEHFEFELVYVCVPETLNL